MVMSPLRQVVRDGRAVELLFSVAVVVAAGTPDVFNPFLLGRHFLRLAIPCLVAAPPPTRLCCWMLVADPLASRFVYQKRKQEKSKSNQIGKRHGIESIRSRTECSSHCQRFIYLFIHGPTHPPGHRNKRGREDAIFPLCLRHSGLVTTAPHTPHFHF